MEKGNGKIEQYCSLLGCIMITGGITLICLLVSVACLSLFVVEAKQHSIVIVSPDSNYQSDSYTVVMACAYPASAVASEFYSVKCSNSSYSCPSQFTCQQTGNGSVPQCLSTSNTCGNSTFCSDYITSLPDYDVGTSKEIDLGYKLGWVIFDYIASITIFFGIIITLILVFLTKGGTWFDTTEDIESSPLTSDEGPNLKMLDSYNHIIGHEEKTAPLGTKDLVYGTIIGVCYITNISLLSILLI